MAFDVASVRQIDPGTPWPGNRFEINAQDDFTPTNGVFRANARLIMYLIFAYKITDTSQYDALIAQLPKWANADQFVIEARAAGNPSKDQYRLMMQGLLADRFGLKLHVVDKVLPVYALVLAKSGRLGPGLQLHPENLPCAFRPEKPMTRPGEQPPAYCGAIQRWQPSPGALHMRMLDVTGTQIADYVSGMDFSLGGLRGLEHHAIVDETGLTGRYELNIEFSPQAPESDAGASGPDFIQALKGQLGLVLVKKSESVPVFIIDHVNRPTEN